MERDDLVFLNILEVFEFACINLFISNWTEYVLCGRFEKLINAIFGINHRQPVGWLVSSKIEVVYQ